MLACGRYWIASVMALLWSSHAAAWQLEVGETSLNWNQFNTVIFQQAFPVGVTPVVVALTPGTRGASNDDPAVVRIKNVTNTGFQMAIVEPNPENGRYESNNTVMPYLAVEPGVHGFPNGDVIEAGTISTTALQHGRGVGGAESWQTQSLLGGFAANPALIGMPQTAANEWVFSQAPGNNRPSQVWVTMAVQNVGATSFQTAIERSEANTQPFFFTLAAETMGYIVMDTGAGGSFKDSGNNDVFYEAFRSGDRITGWQNGCLTSPNGGVFLNMYTVLPKVFATKIKHDGGDGGWIRRCSLSLTQVGLAVDEDRDRDSERSHTTEDVGIFVFSRTFTADIVAEPEPLLKKTVMVDNDPFNGTDKPKAIPDAEVLYTIRVENLGEGVATNVRLDDPVPDNMDLYVGNTENCGSVDFRDGTPSSGLACSALNVSYDDGTGNYNHTPGVGVEFDSAVTDIRIEFTGSLAANSAAGVPSFELDLRMRVR